jgi:hypothetical protein
MKKNVEYILTNKEAREVLAARIEGELGNHKDKVAGVS